MDSRDEAVYLLALVRAYGRQWHRIATLVEVVGTARGIVEGRGAAAQRICSGGAGVRYE